MGAMGPTNHTKGGHILVCRIFDDDFIMCIKSSRRQYIVGHPSALCGVHMPHGALDWPLLALGSRQAPTPLAAPWEGVGQAPVAKCTRHDRNIGTMFRSHYRYLH